MAQESRTVSWNPVTGCIKFSDGCLHCYAETMAARLRKMGVEKYENGFRPTLHPSVLNDPLKLKRGTSVFVPSMGDLFQKDVPDEFIRQVFDTMRKAYWIEFSLLTKRAERLAEFSSKISWPQNVSAGVTVESGKYLHRIDLLRKVPAKKRFLNMEPLLGDVGEMDLSGIDSVSVGGESGPKARPLSFSWVVNIRKQCVAQNVRFSFMQRGRGDAKKKEIEKKIEEKNWEDMPLFKQD